MTQSLKVSGSRTLRKNSKKGSSKKGSKKGSKRHGAYDFSGLLNDMDDMPMQPQQQMQPNMMPMQSPAGMGGMEQMGMPQMAPMGMPQMDQMGMAQMAMPQMGMPQMMMGADAKNVDPLHLHNFVPQNENINLNNYGVNPGQLMSGAQMGQSFAGRAQAQPQMGGGNFGRAMENFYARF
jgi:hypothetical protein